MTARPAVSVVLPAYNAERFIRDAAGSILDQTFRDLELVIVNDGSTDTTPVICSELAARDHRVKIVSQDNQGLPGALNRGVREARGVLIARMDADDIAFPERISKQVEFLEKYRDVGLVSAGFVPFVDISAPFPEPWLFPPDHQSLYALLAFCSPVCHPAVLARRELFDRFPYRLGVITEDHDVWCRAIHSFRFANLCEPLLYYRRHSNSHTAKHSRKIKLSTFRSGVMHILRNPIAYRRACLDCLGTDRTAYAGINWRWMDRINTLLRV